jgi:5-methylcytosine-specific restriction protein A
LCNQYERDPQARRKCIAIYGLNCHICGFNFQKFYGDYGSNFIHVHHLVPISKIGKDYEVNPEKDLIPLCANCHAIVHRVDPPYTAQEVKESINCPLADSQA